MKDLRLKLLSVLIAVSIWIALVSGEYKEVSIYASVKLKNIPERFAAVSSDHLVNVLVKGPNALLKQIEYNDIEVNVDVSGFQMGDTQYHIRLDDVRTPPGIQVASIEPNNITITVDKFIKKTVSVNPTFIGEPKKGFKVESIAVFPDAVEIDGAMSKLGGINSIETMPINLSGRSEAVTYSIGVKMAEGIKTVTPAQVDVYVSFTGDVQQAVFENVLIIPTGLADGLTSKINAGAEITVKGRADLLNKESVSDELSPYVNLEGIEEPGKYYRKIFLKNSDKFQVIKFEPEKVRIEVVNEKILRN